MFTNKIFALILLIGILLCTSDAWAKKSFSTSLVNTPVVVTMGDPAGTSLTYRIKNTNTGGDLGKSINKMEFDLNAPYQWSATTVAPAGWSITTLTSTKIVFTVTADTIPPKIATGSTQDFTLILAAIPSGAQDSTDNLKSVKATYDDGKPPINGSTAFTSWTRKSLSIDSFTAVDNATGLSASTPGSTLTVTLTVTNRSTSNWTGIVSNPQPPTATIALSPTTTVTTSSNPSINLNAGQTGPLVWTYTIGSSCTVSNPPSGTVSFSVTNVQNSTNVATSKSSTSNTVDIGCFNAAFEPFNTCATSGDTMTVRADLTNKFGNDITSATPTLTTGGTATMTRVSGPTPASTTVGKNGGIATVTWSYTITGNPGNTYFFTVSATGTLQSTPAKPVTTPVATSSAGSIFVPPSLQQATPITTDRFQMVTVLFTLTNSFCSNTIEKVGIGLPSNAWAYQDSSALINNSGAIIEDWTSTISGSTVSFTDGTPMGANGLGSGNFSIAFTQIPSAQGTYNFSTTITKNDGTILSGSVIVTVGGTPGPNLSNPKLFKENY